MTTMTNLSGRSGMAADRRGETLIEIMASIMVLCIGLVGVLAAIPFGGFRMSQMTEADNSAAVGRNAIRELNVNGWSDPDSWLLYNPSIIHDPTSAYQDVPNPLVSGQYLLAHTFVTEKPEDPPVYDHSTLDLTYPIVIDPIGAMGTLPPFSSALTPNGGYGAAFLHVSPRPKDASGNFYSLGYTSYPNWYEHIFYQQDDLISGYYETEDETEFRPRVELETKAFNDGTASNAPSFSGRYSWMAFVYPKSNSSLIDQCEFSSVVSADYDAVVFRDRIAGDERAFAATIDGSGYQGGSVTIDLSTCRDADNAVANTDSDYARIREQLTQTRYIMLAGPDDRLRAASSGTISPTKASWYKIANFANINDSTIRLTLIGPDVPANWTNDGSVVTAIFYPGVIGVYSGSTSF